ncbi:MAG: rane protein insertase YidC [Rickettsiales bacterium]|jgi:YidC/Oxa1 family membrane protein insertase|nr:rane protein insertase YidC [Rickettsiales bacterium]
MQDIKSLFLVFAISLGILTAWDYFFVAPGRQAELARQEAMQVEQKKNDVTVPDASIKELVAQNEAAKLVDRDEILTQTQQERISITTPSLHGSLTLKGARLDDLTLASYREHLEKDSPEVVLLSPSGAKDVYFAEFGWIPVSEGIVVPNASSVWESKDKELTPDSPVTLSWDNGKGQRFILEIAVDKDYLFTVTQRVENTTGAAVSLIPYGLLNRTRDMNLSTNMILHEGPIGVFDKTLTEITYKDVHKEKIKQFKDSEGWIGVTDKYWLTAFIPMPEEKFEGRFSYSVVKGQDRFQADYLGQPREIAAGGNAEVTTRFFAGAKQVALLEHYAQSLNAPLFDRALDFGWLYFLTKPMFHALKWIHGIIPNFGLSILLLTICVKLIMFPLANKSYRSFAKMKKLAPQVAELRERFKDDKLKQNQEMMGLYKKEKVNPLSGCLPLLIQIPVFFSLYKVLYITIEMRHAPFFGWIKDLSVQDPTTLFNLFGLIPWTPPSFLMVGILPILMGLTMGIQQRLNPPPADPVQAQVTKMLPWIFVFMFAHFPSGLVLYWVWNNTLSITQQWLINRSVNREK